MANETELAWAAGFFDGEGSVSVLTVKGRGRPEGYMYLHMKVGQVVREPLERFASAVEAGNVTGPYERGGNQPIYTWQAGSTKSARAAIAALWPYLSEFKRAKITAALDKLAQDERDNPRDYYARLRSRIVVLKDKGFTPAEIAEQVGLARRTIYYHLQTAKAGAS